jgi:hypothetical protein
MRKLSYLFMMIGLGAFLCACGAQAKMGGGRPTLLATASDPLLIKVLYRVPKRMVSDVAPSGAISVNAEWESGSGGQWFIEQQRYGADLIQAGTSLKDDELIHQGRKILDWGFAHQGTDGSFPGTGDAFHSTALFVEAAGRAALLLKQYDPTTYADAISTYTSRVHAAARWLTEPEVAETGRKHNQPYTHRRWILAAALGQAAALSGDKKLAAAAEDYAREGLALQTSEGINPEKDGYDVSYQGVGLLQAEHYYLVCPDPDLQAQIRTMLQKGLRWEMSKMDTDGSLSTEGSTRTGTEEGRSGKAKTVDYRELIQAFSFGAAILGDSQFEEAANRIAIGRKWLRE